MIHLLVLSLILTGCEAEREIKACTGGWFEFTCECKMKTCPTIDVKNHRRNVKSTKENTWEQDENMFLYHDTGNQLLRVKVTELTSADSGDYKCKIQEKPTKVELKLKRDGCQETLRQTVYAAAETTVTCSFNAKEKNKFFFCKEEGSDCRVVYPTQPGSLSEGKFTLTIIESVFSVSISDVSSEDGGVYWCGRESARGSYKSSRRQIRLEVKSGSWLRVIVAVVAVMCAAALVFLVVIYKRCERSKNTTQNEDHTYLEIEERPQKPDSGTAPKTLYVTANFPTNVSGSHYSNVLFEKSSGEVSGETYSTVGASYSTVNHPSSFTEKPLDSSATFSVRSSQGP